jgi:hypothetical protein
MEKMVMIILVGTGDPCQCCLWLQHKHLVSGSLLLLLEKNLGFKTNNLPPTFLLLPIIIYIHKLELILAVSHLKVGRRKLNF